MVLALNANGGWAARAAFITLDILWVGFTIFAVMLAIRRKFLRHRNFMIRSYALTLSAITLRTWHIILTQFFVLTPIQIYILEAWLGFVPNFIDAEYLIYSYYRTKSSK